MSRVSRICQNCTLYSDVELLSLAVQFAFVFSFDDSSAFFPHF